MPPARAHRQRRDRCHALAHTVIQVQQDGWIQGHHLECIDLTHVSIFDCLGSFLWGFVTHIANSSI